MGLWSWLRVQRSSWSMRISRASAFSVRPSQAEIRLQDGAGEVALEQLVDRWYPASELGFGGVESGQAAGELGAQIAQSVHDRQGVDEARGADAQERFGVDRRRLRARASHAFTWGRGAGCRTAEKGLMRTQSRFHQSPRTACCRKGFREPVTLSRGNATTTSRRQVAYWMS